MSYAWVQGTSIQGKAITSLSKAFASSNTANNLIVAGSGSQYAGASTATATFSDGSSNTYATDVTDAATSKDRHVHVGHAVVTAGGGTALTVTVTFSANTQAAILCIDEYSGNATTSPFDVGGTSDFAAATTSFSGPVETPAVANSLVVGMASLAAPTAITAEATPWNDRQNVPGSASGRPGDFEDLLNASGSQQPTWTSSSSTTGCCATAVYRPASSGIPNEIVTVLQSVTNAAYF